MSTTESDVEVSSSAYSYNINGIRDSKTEGGVTTSYVVDSNRDYAQVLEEIVDGLSTVSYSYGHDLVSQNRSDEFKFYQYDGLGSTRGLSNSAGVVTDNYDYEAFGDVLNETGTTDNNYKFTGEQFDSSLDQYYLRARYYDQGVGRFTQQDTYMGNNFDPVSLHKYLYGNADPVTYTDPSGKFGITGAMATNTMIGVLAGASIVGYSVGQGLANGNDSSSYNGGKSMWVLLASMAGSSSSLLDLVTSKLAEDTGGSVIMYHGSSIDSLVSLLNGVPLSTASAMEQKFPGEEGTLLGFYLTPDYIAAEFFGMRRGGGVIQFEFTTSAFQAVRSGSTTRPIAPIGSSSQSPGTEMIVQPIIFPLFDSLRQSGQIKVTPAQ